MFGSLVDYSFLTGDKQYDDLLGQGFQHQLGDGDAFMPANQTKVLGNDDQATWGLAAMSAAENSFSTAKIGNLTWAVLASNVFDTQVLRWNDKTCKGGLNWQIYQFNNGYTYKNAISAGTFFLLASRLAKFTGNATYSEWAEKSFDWAQTIGFIDTDYSVYDGADENKDCTSINEIQWSYTNGLFLEGAAHMFNISQSSSDEWKKAVTGFANVTVTNFVENKVLYEVACEKAGKCNVDMKAYKGLAARSYARAMVSAPFVSGVLTPVLEASAEAAAEDCTKDGDNVKCSLRWSRGDNDHSAGLGESFSALAVTQALLVPEAKALATSASANGTAGSATQDAPGANGSGSVKPKDNEGGAGAVFVSRGLVGLAAVVAVALL